MPILAKSTDQAAKGLLTYVPDVDDSRTSFDDTDEASTLKTTQRSAWAKKLRTSLVVLGGITTALLLLIILSNTQLVLSILKSHTSATKDTATIVWKECGSNSTAARAAGCRFDLMLTAWIHEDCFDDELMESYLAAHEYKWYADSALTTTVPDAVVRQGDHFRVYVVPEFHYVHCAYMWEMQMRAWKGAGAIDQRIWDLGHSTHCGKLLLEHVLPRNYTRLTVAFDRCGIP